MIRKALLFLLMSTGYIAASDQEILYKFDQALDAKDFSQAFVLYSQTTSGACLKNMKQAVLNYPYKQDAEFSIFFKEIFPSSRANQEIKIQPSDKKSLTERQKADPTIAADAQALGLLHNFRSETILTCMRELEKIKHEKRTSKTNCCRCVPFSNSLSVGSDKERSSSPYRISSTKNL